MVKVIWHKTASPPQTDGSIVFARWRQCALPSEHTGATWWIRSNLCFLEEPSEVQNLNGKSIVSAAFAQLAVVSSGTLAPPGEYDWIDASFGPTVSTTQTQTANRSVQPFLHSSYARKSLYFTTGDLFLKNCPFSLGHLDPQLTHDFLGPFEPISQTASRSVQPFLHRWPHRVSLYFTLGRPFPLKTAHSRGGDLDPNLVHDSLGPPQHST